MSTNNPDVETPEVEEALDPMAAMDKAMDELTPEPAEPIVDEESLAVDEADKPAETPEAKEPEAKEPEAAKPEVDTEAEAEIVALGLKERSAARFRELTAEVKELAPIREALKSAGIEDIADIPKIVERAKAGEDMISMVMETGMDARQYGMVLDYGKFVSGAMKGDRASAEKALELAQAEVVALSKALGKEVAGVYDPIAEHKDLAEAVENGEITREYALQVAASRVHQGAVKQVQEQNTQQQQQEAAIAQGIATLNGFEAHMQSDPQWAAKRPILNAMVANIRQTLPPAQWLAATQNAYAMIPDVAVAPAPKPVVSAVRPSGPRPNMAPATFNSAEEALDYALKHG